MVIFKHFWQYFTVFAIRMKSSKYFFKFFAFNNFLKSIKIIMNVLSDFLRILCSRKINSSSKEAFSWFYMYIISCKDRLFSSWCYISSQISFIRIFVMRKSSISINAKSAVFGLRSNNSFIKKRSIIDRILCKFIERHSYFVI